MSVALKIGSLNSLIQIREDTGGRDAHNQTSVNFTNLTAGNVWASVRPLNGKELVYAQAVENEVTHKITIRYLSTVTPKMQVIYDSRTFEILSAINVDERNWITEMMCREMV